MPSLTQNTILTTPTEMYANINGDSNDWQNTVEIELMDINGLLLVDNTNTTLFCLRE